MMYRPVLAISLLVFLLFFSSCSPAPAASPTSAPAKPAATTAPAKPAATTAPAKTAVNYPTRPITVIIPFAPGGGTDLMSRIILPHMEKTLGQTILIENREGGRGATGLAVVDKAAPDGYTLGVATGGPLHILPHMEDVPFDPLKWSYVGSYFEFLYVLTASGEGPWKTVQEFVDDAKANPGKYLHSNSGGFGITDIGLAQLSEAVGGFDVRTLPTTGNAPAVTAVLAGDSHVVITTPGPGGPHIKSGALRPLLTMSPEWPELDSMGVPRSNDLYGFSLRNLSAMVGPPGLPEDIRAKLEDAMRVAMQDKAVLDKMNQVGELTVFKTGAENKADVAEMLKVHGEIIEKLGYKKK